MASNIPSEKKCLEIMKSCNMLQNIIDHSIQVKNVSVAIVENLKNPEIVNIDLVIAGALLHDIAKSRTIKSGEMRHDLLGGEMLKAIGYDTVAPIVEAHIFFEGFDPDGMLDEKEIIYYADKRVMHDIVVSIDERVDDLVERYGVNENVIEMIKKNKKFVLKVEEKIQSFLNSDIEEIIEKIK